MDVKKSIIKEILDWLLVLVVAGSIALIVNNFIIVNCRVPSASMEQTIMTGDRAIGFRLAYLFDEPKRGDIVIFRFPDDEEVLYIKRVIGLPGDKVEIKDGIVYINGEEYAEDYIGSIDLRSFGPYNVPDDSYFMLGDNRAHSADSREWNHTYVKREKILGKAIFKYWPSFSKL